MSDKLPDGPHHEVIIRAVGRPYVGRDWAWEAEVFVDGEGVGSGTAPEVDGALSVAMDILYGDTNDHHNGDFGALENIRRFTSSGTENGTSVEAHSMKAQDVGSKPESEPPMGCL